MRGTKILVLSLTLIGLGACVQKKPAVRVVVSSPTLRASATQTSSPPTNTPTSTFTPTSSPLPTIRPTNTLTPTPITCWDDGGWIEDGQIETELLPHPLSFRIYIPPCYEQLLDKRYPVLYLIHGQEYNDDQWDRLGIDEAADALITSKEIPALIIVMPHERSWRLPTENNFGEALIHNLIPWIDSHYRTLPNRSFRAIGGLSRGANWAVHLGLSYWDFFGAIGAHSLALFPTDGPKIPGWLDAIPVNKLPRIYLDIGEKDKSSTYSFWFENLLNEKGIPHEWYLYPGYHDEEYWESHVDQYLRWYAESW